MKTVKKFVSILCLLSLLCSVLSTAVLAATSSTGYEEGDGWINENPNAPTDYAYSIAVVGDTQTIVKKDLANGTNYMSSIYSWIANNVDAKNIQYVLGVGDITEYAENFDSSFDGSWTYADEWDHAKAAITLLDGKVPYSLCRGGGHDTVNKMNEYFASHEYYVSNLAGTYAENDVTSTYSMFEVGSVKYLLFALDWNPSDDVLAWAEGIIEDNTDRRVIITTHAYLAADGTLHGSDESHTSVPTTNNGVDIYEKLVSKHSNIQLVISGHNPSANLVYRQDATESGGVVTSLLVDPQNFDAGRNGETGMVCMLYFSEDGNTVNVEWRSTVREQYYKESNQFTLALDQVKVDGKVVTKYGSFPEEFADAEAYPFLTFINGEFVDCGAYDFFAYASGTLERYLRNNTTASDKVVVIAQRNFTVMNSTSGYYVSNYVPADVTLDLMGHTVTNASNTSTTNLISSAASKDFDTNLTIKNGTISLAKALLSVSTGGEGGAKKTQSFTFEDLDIITSHTNLLVYNQVKTESQVNINFINCDISSENLGSHIFRAGKGSSDTNNWMKVDLTVKGGSLSVSTFTDSEFVQEYNGGSVRFIPNDEGEMMRLILPSGTAVSNKTYRDSDGNAVLYTVKHSADGTNDEYVLENLVTPYGTIPYEMSSHVDYPFLPFANGEVVKLDDGKSYDLFNGNNAGEIERKLRSLKVENAVVIARCDHTVKSGGDLLTNYQLGVFTIDLMGYTLDAGVSNPLFASNGTQAINNSLVVKNGKIILGKALMTVSINKNVEGKIQDFTFENLDIVTSNSFLITYNQIYSAGNVNINFVNCNIKSDTLDSHIYRAGKGSADTNNWMKVALTVTGGSLSVDSFDSGKFVQEYNGGTVRFLPNSDGEYTLVRVSGKTASSLAGEYTVKVGENEYTMGLIYSGDDNGYGVYRLRDSEKLISPKASLTMHSAFVYNVYVPASAKEFITSITFGGTSYDVSALPVKQIGGVDYLHIEFEIGVLDAGETFELTVASAAQRQRWSLGVISYADTVIGGSYTDTTKTLARDILAYIREAYLYAKSENVDTVKTQIDAIIGADYAVAPDTAADAKQSVDGLDGAGLVLGNRPAFYFLPELDSEGETVYDATAYKFAVDGTSVRTEVTTIEGKTAILVYTYAFAITDTVTYTVDGTDISGEYNLAAYLEFASGDEALLSLVKALWQYSDAARAYRDEVVS